VLDAGAAPPTRAAAAPPIALTDNCVPREQRKVYDVRDIARALVDGGVRLRGLSLDRPALEDLFVSITGEGFDVVD